MALQWGRRWIGAFPLIDLGFVVLDEGGHFLSSEHRLIVKYCAMHGVIDLQDRPEDASLSALGERFAFCRFLMLADLLERCADAWNVVAVILIAESFPIVGGIWIGVI
ncbi:hypothetical protein BKK80_30730 [Cupriavidus malaysiensis]|uniref:Uncharacterized protein n=1 Tax=Cupriavidus malaysiensis TaxID=367825 RepID=A0ABM6FDY7_9BURK|nr:hypothetical protein BKK80_30730 [Cupriavidus malaysiensis]